MLSWTCWGFLEYIASRLEKIGHFFQVPIFIFIHAIRSGRRVFICNGFLFTYFFFHSAPEGGLYCKPKYRAILSKIIQSFTPFYFILVILVCRRDQCAVFILYSKISTDPGLLEIRHSHRFVAVVIQFLIPKVQNTDFQLNDHGAWRGWHFRAINVTWQNCAYAHVL